MCAVVWQVSLGEVVKRLVWSVLLVLVVSMLAACGDDDDETETRTAATDSLSQRQRRSSPIWRATWRRSGRPLRRSFRPEPTRTISSRLPADVEQIADADLILEHGLGYDEWAHDLAEQSGTDAMIVEVTDGVATIEGAEHDDGDDHSDVDPHVWFDVANVKVMTANIRDALIDIDPDGRETYEANTDAYLAELEELDGWIHEQVATIPEADRKLVTTHEAFGYYVAAYGFEYVGAVIPSLDSQAQPSAKQVEALLDQIEAEGVGAIFTETTVNPDLAKQIADEADIEVVTDLYSDSLSDDGSETDTYIGMMRHNTTAIVEALT